MFYKFVKIWANISFRFYFRRIFVSGTEHIPKNAAVLFIVNHPNSFLEACLVACFQHRDLHFLVRGDMFEKKWLKPILKWTNQIPIFRFKDGFTNMKKNKSTFDESFKVLADGKAILIFPEASTLMVKYLRPLQKGAARLALGAIEEFNIEPLYVIPTGIFYSAPTKARSDVMIRFGKSVEIKKWLSTCTDNSDKLTEITKTFEKHLDQVVVSIHPEQDVREFDKLCDMVEPKLMPFPAAQKIQAHTAFEKMKQFALNYQQLNHQDHKLVRQTLGEYSNKFTSLPSLNFRLDSSIFQRSWLILKLCFTFLISIPGILCYGIPLLLSKQFAKTKIKHIEFYAPVRLAVSMFLHASFSVIAFWVITTQMNMFWGMIIVVLLQFSLFGFMLFLDFAAYAKYSFTGISEMDKKEKQKLFHRIEKLFSL
ncbi:MAG: 1-acyl-sn-glycerol-3-phosphate acyltransferase [Saprospiraceae bacterium]|nr:1-acyl-sn-glycerol-3-phosphate acyltransferase [Saprospiraceae bacterium]